MEAAAERERNRRVLIGSLRPWPPEHFTSEVQHLAAAHPEVMGSHQVSSSDIITCPSFTSADAVITLSLPLFCFLSHTLSPTSLCTCPIFPLFSFTSLSLSLFLSLPLSISPPQLLGVCPRRPPPRKIIMNVSVDDVQLKKAENAWKPGLKREAASEDTGGSKTQVRREHMACVCVCVCVCDVSCEAVAHGVLM